MPAVDEVAEEDFVRLSQLYGRYARVTAHDMSEQFEGPPTWSEIDLAQAIARMAGRARLVQRRSRRPRHEGP